MNGHLPCWRLGFDPREGRDIGQQITASSDQGAKMVPVNVGRIGLSASSMLECR